MNHNKLTVTLLGLLLTSPLCMAEAAQQSQQPQPTLITLEKKKRGTTTIRPKAPDRQIITCAYDGDELHFSFVIPEGMATLSVTDETLITATYEFDTTPLEAIVSVGELFGTISLQLETVEGNHFEGSHKIEYIP